LEGPIVMMQVNSFAVMPAQAGIQYPPMDR